MTIRNVTLLFVLLALPLIGGCNLIKGSGGGGSFGGSRSGSLGDAGVARETDESALEPAVRTVTSGQVDLLWKAARGYIERYFPLDVDDADHYVAETKTWQWEHDRMPYRSRITVQIANDPLSPGMVRLGVLARLQQPKGLLEALSTGGAQESDDWVLVGTHQEMQDFVADKILQRYMLLRQGRDPDAQSSKETLLGRRPRNTGN